MQFQYFNQDNILCSGLSDYFKNKLKKYHELLKHVVLNAGVC